jgi:ATP-dependent Lon protease
LKLKSTEYDRENYWSTDIDKLDIVDEKNRKIWENKKYLGYIFEDLETMADECDFRKLHIDIIYLLKKTEEEKNEYNELPDMDYQKIKVFDMNYIVTTLKGCNERNVKAVLSKFKNTPRCGNRYLKPADQDFLNKIKELKINFPNCVEFLEYIESFAALSTRSKTKAFKIPPVLLAGSAGIGKTEIVKEITKALKVQYRQIDCGALTSPAVISGSAITYSDSKAGSVVEILRDGVYANASVLYDEIDKCRRNINTGYDMVGCLYSLLEQSSAKEFVDEALCIPVDASHINHFATANDLSKIDAPMLSRFTVIRIGDVEGQHHRAVTQSIYKSLIKQNGYEKTFKSTMSDKTFEKLESLAPRQVKIVLLRAMANAAFHNNNKKILEIKEENLVFDFKKTEIENRVPMGFY